jgi:hypothetical protein
MTGIKRPNRSVAVSQKSRSSKKKPNENFKPKNPLLPSSRIPVPNGYFAAAAES